MLGGVFWSGASGRQSLRPISLHSLGWGGLINPWCVYLLFQDAESEE